MSQLPPHDSVHCHAVFQTLQCRHETGASEPAVQDRQGAENSSGMQGPPHKGEGSTGRQDRGPELSGWITMLAAVPSCATTRVVGAGLSAGTSL